MVLITAHSGPDSRAACYVACCALPSRPVVVSGFIGFYRALSGFIRFYPVLSGFIRFTGFGGFYRALVGFRGLSWVWVGFSASVLVDVGPRLVDTPRWIAVRRRGLYHRSREHHTRPACPSFARRLLFPCARVSAGVPQSSDSRQPKQRGR